MSARNNSIPASSAAPHAPHTPRTDGAASPDLPTDLRKRVFLVDDHAILRRGVATMINMEADLTVSGEAGDADEAMEAITAARPDVVVVDVSLHAADGLDLVRALRSRDAALPLLVLSMHDETIYAERALRAGANGYVMKGEAFDTLVRALHQVLRGQVYLSDRCSAMILGGLVGARRRSGGRASLADLTDRELQVFQCIGQGLSIEEIAERLIVSPKTVAAHREHIRRKLHLQNSAELLRLAMQHHLADAHGDPHGHLSPQTDPDRSATSPLSAPDSVDRDLSPDPADTRPGVGD